MLPPRTKETLERLGHEATTPLLLGAANLADSELTRIATDEGWVIVTENARDFAGVTRCPVVLVRKSWWLLASLPPTWHWPSTDGSPRTWLRAGGFTGWRRIRAVAAQGRATRAGTAVASEYTKPGRRSL